MTGQCQERGAAFITGFIFLNQLHFKFRTPLVSKSELKNMEEYFAHAPLTTKERSVAIGKGRVAIVYRVRLPSPVSRSALGRGAFYCHRQSGERHRDTDGMLGAKWVTSLSTVMDRRGPGGRAEHAGRCNLLTGQSGGRSLSGSVSRSFSLTRSSASWRARSGKTAMCRHIACGVILLVFALFFEDLLLIVVLFALFFLVRRFAAR